ncbi:MAG: S24 family peptidase [Methylocella sp.]
MPDLARALDWTLAELMRRISPSAPPSNGSAEIMGSVSEAFAVALEAPPLADLDIPVLGAIGAADFQAPRLTNTEMVPKPWPLRGREGIYALYVVGGSMAPIFPSGATIYVDSKAEPKQGDYAVFKATSYPGAKESRRYLRLVKAISDTHLHCAQISPPIEDYHRIENIKWMHRIIMPGE